MCHRLGFSYCGGATTLLPMVFLNSDQSKNMNRGKALHRRNSDKPDHTATVTFVSVTHKLTDGGLEF